MKLIRFFTAALIMAATFTACSKDKNDVPESPKTVDITGTYEGKIGTSAALPTGHFALQVKQDGKIDRVSADKSISGTGTWTMNGASFKAEYTATNGVKVKIAATFDKFSGKLTGGKWENDANNDGTWYASKKDN